MRYAICIIGSLVGLIGCGEDVSANTAVGGGADKQRPQKPNILLYIVDTLREDALACYGNPIVHTPAIDRLAKEGVLCECPLSEQHPGEQ